MYEGDKKDSGLDNSEPTSAIHLPPPTIEQRERAFVNLYIFTPSQSPRDAQRNACEDDYENAFNNAPLSRSSANRYWRPYLNPGDSSVWWYCEDTETDSFMENTPKEWERYKDPTSMAEYWYNSVSGEFFWIGERALT